MAKVILTFRFFSFQYKVGLGYLLEIHVSYTKPINCYKKHGILAVPEVAREIGSN